MEDVHKLVDQVQRRGVVAERLGSLRAEIDVPIATGEKVVMYYGSANRDEKHFANAERFDVRRDASKSIAFGAGPHFCAGAWASRATCCRRGCRGS